MSCHPDPGGEWYLWWKGRSKLFWCCCGSGVGRLLGCWLVESKSALGKGFALENALSVAWDAIPGGLHGYFPYDVQVFCNAATRLKEETSYAAHESGRATFETRISAYL